MISVNLTKTYPGVFKEARAILRRKKSLGKSIANLFALNAKTKKLKMSLSKFLIVSYIFYYLIDKELMLQLLILQIFFYLVKQF